MDQKNRIAMILNKDSFSHMLTIPAYQLSMIDGRGVTDALRGMCTRYRMGE